MIIGYTIAFIVSVLTAILLISSKKYSSDVLGDAVHASKHNLHHHPAPRIGGIAILIGILAGLYSLYLINHIDIIWVLTLLLCAFIVFFTGLIEDLTGSLSSSYRLFIIFIASILAFILLDAQMLNTGIEKVDQWLRDIPLLSLLVTIMLVTGMTNATNMIDGLHGLMLFSSIVALASLAICAYLVGDILIIQICLLILAASVGLFVLNVPFGKIFAGDSGAYLLGFLLAEIALLLTNRNEAISAWAPVLIMIYPISDLLFSMFRRVIIQKTTVGMPDKIHLHSLLYRFLLLRTRSKNKNFINMQASIILWHIPLISAPLAIYFRDDDLSLVLLSICFLTYYILLYWLVTNKAMMRNK